MQDVFNNKSALYQELRPVVYKLIKKVQKLNFVSPTPIPKPTQG